MEARNCGQRKSACQGILSNMTAKHSKEMYGLNKTHKIEGVMVYKEQCQCRDAVEFSKVFSPILVSCFSSTNVTCPAFHRSLFSKLGHSLSNFSTPTRFSCAVSEDIKEKFKVPQCVAEKHSIMHYMTNFHLQS